MEFQRRESGLVVPASKTPEPQPQGKSRAYGPLEIKDLEQRRVATEAMLQLWTAMDLSRGSGGVQLPGRPSLEVIAVYRAVYGFVGSMLLGKDCPEKEVLC